MARFGQHNKEGSLVAGADLSTNQYRGVRVSAANTVGAITASTQLALGIQLNDAAEGEAVEVATHGVVKAVAGAAIAAGAELMFDTQGRVITAVTATNRTIGTALEAASAAGEVITIMLGALGRVL